MDYRVLGPLEVYHDGRLVAIGGTKPRALLALLILHRNEPVTVDCLVDQLWPVRPPATAEHVVQVYVSGLRKALAVGESRVVRRPGAYMLAVVPGEVDADRFERELTESRGLLSDHPELAARRLEQALMAWRGRAYADFAYDEWALAEAERLDELRLLAIESRAEALHALGRDRELVPQLEGLVAEHPARERLCVLLMRALYRTGRQVDALAVYQAVRRQLVDELGLEPGRELQQLERAILTHDPALAAPPTHGSEPTPRLPRVPDRLIGRDAEIAEIRALLGRPDVRLITLTGVGGTGKTRLAIEVAHQAAADFTGGAVFVPLAPIEDTTLLPSAIAEALEIGETAGVPLLQLVSERLALRPLLLVLDNFEQLLGAAAVVAELLAASPDVRALVTSRAPLRVSAECNYPVPPLEVPAPGTVSDAASAAGCAAIELFVNRAGAASAGFRLTSQNAPAVAEICRRLDGLPLAIELAAARVPLLSPEAILERLERPLALLTQARRDAPDRQRTLRAAIDWSYELLDAHERFVFRQVAVFAGGFSLEAAEAVCVGGATDLELFEVVASLFDQSLLRRTDERRGVPRFAMLATIREYALELLRVDPAHESARQRHAEWYLELAERLEPELVGPFQAARLAELEQEHANLRAALDHLAERGQTERLARAAASLRRFWLARGHLSEGRRWLETALADPRLSREIRLKALLNAGPVVFALADGVAAQTYLTEALKLARPLRDDRSLVLALTWLGYIARDGGDLERARALGEEAGSIATALGDSWLIAVALTDLANTVYELGDAESAMQRLQQATALFRRAGDRHNNAVALQNLGEIAVLNGDYADAEGAFEESLALAAELGSPVLAAHARGYLGLTALHRGAPDQAAAFLMEALPVMHGLGDTREVLNFLRLLAAAAAVTGEAARAAALWGVADSLRDAAGLQAERALLRDEHVPRPGPDLDEVAFARELERGRVMTLDEGIAFALLAGAPELEPGLSES